MSTLPLKVLAALVAAFVIGTLGGGLLTGGGDGDLAESRIGFNPDEEKGPEPEPEPEKAGPPAEFTAEAVLEKSGRIVISGVAAGVKPGTPLVVQRKESGGWTDFPADTRTGSGGDYSVWLKTGRSGENTFRVMDKDSGEASNPVTVKL